MTADRLSELGDVAGELVTRIKTHTLRDIFVAIGTVRVALDRVDFNAISFAIAVQLDGIANVAEEGLPNTRLALTRMAGTIETMIEDLEELA
jgi:hypothetical protein